ncbi:protein kinase [Shewanella sp. A32]|uniref:protein kinase domain-containing protein n=1 Tax=Shewanella sp. A32 TaxID=3031327 RepID=UPI0023BA39E9|nr:protein kinase [Shewanella sp. A32]MDF0534932.1 protein kinase [Shewanella sp. A32]
MELHFKDISGKDSVGDFTWIHQSGRQAVLIDMVSAGEVRAGLEAIKLWLVEQQSTEVFTVTALLAALHTILLEHRAQAACAVLTALPHHQYECYSVGNLRFYRVDEQVRPINGQSFEVQPSQVLGQVQFPSAQYQRFDATEKGLFLVTSDGLNDSRLQQAQLSAEKLKAGNLYQAFLPAVQEQDWSILMFPMSTTQTFVDSHWPYNPFVGPQEEREHERRALGELATALFAVPQFNGFRIVACPPLLTANRSRLFDGLLVYPFGVMPLELKDHHGHITLNIDSRNGMQVNNDLGCTSFANPVHKLREGLRPFADHSLLKPLDPMLKNAAAVVFTSANAEVECIYNGGSFALPFTQAGEVMVASTATFTAMLLKHCKARFGKKLTARLIEADINRLVAQFSEPTSATPVDEYIWIDDYQCGTQPLPAESTDYYQVYPGKDYDTPIWVKAFKFDHLSSVHRQSEMQMIGREARILNRLGKTTGVQYCYGKHATDDKLYIFLEAAPQQNLTAWLQSNPTREARLNLLLSVCRILAEIQQIQGPAVIHRAINPNNIRVKADNSPLLINFELCQFESVATLPITARRTFEQKYQAPEVNQPGQTLTFAADIYSVGLLACLLLADVLPFNESAKELLAKGRRQQFWGQLCVSLGIEANANNVEFWQRILHITPEYRPTITQTIEAVKTWMV